MRATHVQNAECIHKNAPKDCCKDHVKVLKVQNDQNLPNAYFSKIILQNALPVDYFSFSSSVFINNKNKKPESYTPSLRSSKISYCILYCTFLI